MKLVAKNRLAAIAAGVCILAGAASPFIVNAAAQPDQNRPAIEHRQIDPDTFAQRMAEDFNVSQKTVLKYHNDGVKYRDIYHAALLARISGDSLDQVMSLKTDNTTWKDIAHGLNINPAQIKATRQDLFASHMNTKLGIDKGTTLGLLEQGKHPRDIMAAGKIANAAGKSINEVVAIKTPDNKWSDIADQLGVNKNDLKLDHNSKSHKTHTDK